jgi:hypothetical protein
MPTLLYYPLAKPPLEVVHEALLYWDGIASIVSERQEAYERSPQPDVGGTVWWRGFRSPCRAAWSAARAVMRGPVFTRWRLRR